MPADEKWGSPYHYTYQSLGFGSSVGVLPLESNRGPGTGKTSDHRSTLDVVLFLYRPSWYGGRLAADEDGAVGAGVAYVEWVAPRCSFGSTITLPGDAA